MDELSYVQGVFNKHVARAGLLNQLSGKNILELGPGDSVAMAVLANCHGAKIILIDSGDYASRDVRLYQSFAKSLKEQGLDAPDLSSAKTREDVLEICGAQYLSSGLSSLQEITDSSVDLVFSQAVLEHVRRKEFLNTIKECHRILRTNGSASHTVDLKDHLGGGLDNLRFSGSIWESDFFVRSGFYTNRIRYSDMIASFKQAGFNIDIVNAEKWDACPIKRKNLAPEFNSIANEDLLVKEFDVLLRPVESSVNTKL